MSNLLNDQEYKNFLLNVKEQIQQAQVKAVIVVNAELIKLYWSIGNEILTRQNTQKWGSRVVEKLSKDLKSTFPDLKGFSKRNLLYMRRFAEEYPSFEFVQAVLAQISWYHNIALLEKCSNNKKRLWYAQKAIENGWSRNVMVMQIETDLYTRNGAAINNFQNNLPSADSDMVEQALKDPYIFDFLNLTEQAHEKDIEKALVDNIAQFLLELGKGFAFVGRQYHINVGQEDFYIDLLFFNIELECYVVIELKTKKFKPEHAGQIGFYLTAVDMQIKKDHHKPTIGLIICKEKNAIVAEYALGHIRNPIGISEYKLSEELESKIKKTLPSIEELEKGLTKL